MAKRRDRDRASASPSGKGRPTVGRKQQQAAARRAARRRAWQVRLWWALGAALFAGLVIVLIVTGWGASPDPLSG